jgi:hypothetical protein
MAGERTEHASSAEGQSGRASDPDRACLAVGFGGHRQDAGSCRAGVAAAAQGHRSQRDPVPHLHQGGRRGNVRAHHSPARQLGTRRRSRSSRRSGCARASRLRRSGSERPANSSPRCSTRPAAASASRRSTVSASRCSPLSRWRRASSLASARSISARKQCCRARRWPRCWSMPSARGAAGSSMRSARCRCGWARARPRISSRPVRGKGRRWPNSRS